MPSRSGIAGLYDNYMFIRNCQTVRSGSCILHSHHNVWEFQGFTASLELSIGRGVGVVVMVLLCFLLFIFVTPGVWFIPLFFISISLITNDAELFFSLYLLSVYLL